jgi:hypothetical protein
VSIPFLDSEHVTFGNSHRHVRFGDRIEVLAWPCHACIRVDEEFFIFASGVLISGATRSDYSADTYVRTVLDAIDCWLIERPVSSPTDAVILRAAADNELLDEPPADLDEAQGRLAAFFCHLPSSRVSFRFRNTWSWDLSGPSERYGTALIAMQQMESHAA